MMSGCNLAQIQMNGLSLHGKQQLLQVFIGLYNSSGLQDGMCAEIVEA